MSVTGSVVRATFPTMGNTAHVTVVDGDAALLDHARVRLDELEQLWSRFIATSEISVLNRSQGRAVRVSNETAQLVRYMIAGWSTTGGLFDPSMLGELVRDGYEQSRVSSSITVLPSGVAWAQELSAVMVEDDVIVIPLGTVLDPGGIGKGLAADIVVGELIDRGASGVFVSVGGDVRCEGLGDCDGRWVIDIESPFDHQSVGSIALASGAIATSSVSAKTFVSPADGLVNSMRSHIMDPRNRRTLDPTRTKIVQSSVVAAECVWAEVFATAHLVLDDPRRIEYAVDHGIEAMNIGADGTIICSSGWKRYQV